MAAQVDHIKIVDEFDIVERHRRVLRDGPLQLDVVREADRQSAERQAFRGRYRVGPYRKAAFAVERLAGFEVALSGAR